MSPIELGVKVRIVSNNKQLMMLIRIEGKQHGFSLWVTVYNTVYLEYGAFKRGMVLDRMLVGMLVKHGAFRLAPNSGARVRFPL